MATIVKQSKVYYDFLEGGGGRYKVFFWLQVHNVYCTDACLLSKDGKLRTSMSINGDIIKFCALGHNETGGNEAASNVPWVIHAMRPSKMAALKAPGFWRSAFVKNSMTAFSQAWLGIHQSFLATQCLRLNFLAEGKLTGV